MTLILIILYAFMFIFLVITMIKCFKNKVKWLKLILFEIFLIVLSFILFYYYNSLPGRGMMPGLTYIGEVVVSFIATILFILMLVLTLIIKIIKYLSKKQKKK